MNRADREFAGVVVVEGLNNRDELDVVGKQKPKWGTLAVAVYRAAKQPLKQGSKSMEVISKTRALVVKHEDLLFKIAFLLVLDHLVFKGEMRNKLKAFAEKLFNRVMASLD